MPTDIPSWISRIFIRSPLGVFALAVALGGCSADVVDTPITDIGDLDTPVALRTWLVAGPLPSPDLGSRRSNQIPARAGFDLDYLEAVGGETGFHATEGAEFPGPLGDSYLFRRFTWNTPYIDLTELYGRPANVAAYLYTEIESDEARHAYFHIGLNDAGKVWVNGELVLSYPIDTPARRSERVVSVDLPAGRSHILVKIDQAGANWGGYFELAKTPTLSDVDSTPRPGRSSSIFPRSSQAFVSLWVLGVFVVPPVAIVIAILIYVRYRREADKAYVDNLTAMMERGVPPHQAKALLTTTKEPSTHPVRSAFFAGLALTLGGFGLTITEIVHAGFGNAGFELFVMFTGVALLASYFVTDRRKSE